MNKLFSIIKERRLNPQTNFVDVRLILRIFGIKITIKLYDYMPVKDYDNLFSWYIDYNWQTLKDSKIGYNFERELQNLELASFVTNTPLPKLVQLAFISICIEDKAYSKAMFLINQYITKHGEDDLCEYGVIADFMIKNNLSSNNKMAKTAKLYNILAKAEEENVLANYLKGKNVAVVGNGPYEIGKNKGDEIDGLDVVYRFNDYSVDSNFEKDYGRKTTIWSIGELHDFKDFEKRDLSQLKYILIAVPCARRRFSEFFVDKILEIHEKYGIDLVPVNSKYFAEISDITNINFITGGFSALNYAIYICGKENVDAYGFSFLNKEATATDAGLNRYFETRDIKLVHSWHNFAKESEYLRDIYKNCD